MNAYVKFHGTFKMSKMGTFSTLGLSSGDHEQRYDNLAASCSELLL